VKRCLPLVAAALLAVGCGVSDDGDAGVVYAAGRDAAEPARRDFELDYRATVPVPDGASTVDVWIPLPQDDENQEVELAALQAPGEVAFREESEFGARMLHVRLEAPRRPVEIGYRVRVARREALRRPGAADGAADGRTKHDPEIAKWLEPDARVPLDGRIRSLSAEVTAGAATDLEMARAIYDYVVETMSYSKEGTGWGNGDIYWACDAKRGNCTDFHALFTGLARAAGIPAKFAIGFPIPVERGAGEIGGYHCWSEFWLDGHGWVPVDASEARKDPGRHEYFFGSHDENRVELTEGRDLVLAPTQQGDPLNYFVYPYAEADGRPIEGVERTFRYRDLDVRRSAAPRQRTPTSAARGATGKP